MRFAAAILGCLALAPLPALADWKPLWIAMDAASIESHDTTGAATLHLDCDAHEVRVYLQVASKGSIDGPVGRGVMTLTVDGKVIDGTPMNYQAGKDHWTVLQEMPRFEGRKWFSALTDAQGPARISSTGSGVDQFDFGSAGAPPVARAAMRACGLL